MIGASFATADDRALGGVLRVVVTRPLRLSAAKGAVDRSLEEMDAAASRFRADSELSRINASPEREVRVTALLGRAISEALRGARLTRGAVDPTVGMALRLSGYDTDFAAMAADRGPIALVAERIPGWRAVRYHDQTRTLWLPRGVELDLGSTAKALAADMAAAAALKAAGEGGVLVSLGGDIAVAGEAPPGAWPIQVSEDSGASISDEVDPRRSRPAPHHRPGHRPAHRRAVAHGDRCRGLLRGRQHRLHRRHRHGRSGDRVAR